MMGVPRWEDGAWGDQRPHRVKLDTFSIDRYEVTNKAFKEFVDATGRRTEAEKEGWGPVLAQPTLKAKRVKASSWERPKGTDSVFSTDRDQHPIVSVSWNDAKAYCEWKGNAFPQRQNGNMLHTLQRRLFIGGEIEGNTWSGILLTNFLSIHSRWNKSLTRLKQTTGSSKTIRIDMYEQQLLGPFKPNAWGLYDMAGNAAERVSTRNNDESKKRTRIARRGSWVRRPYALALDAREALSDKTSKSSIGFRCAKNARGHH